MTDKPKTAEEILALPVGPEVEREYTPEEIKQGFYVSSYTGKKRPVRGRRISEYRPVRYTLYDLDDFLYVTDKNGRGWRLGQWRDGAYFKEPTILP